MTPLVARQCRLLGAARSLRRLPAAMTTRAYVGDASPELPFKIRKIAAREAGGRPTASTTSLSCPQADESTFAARKSKSRAKVPPPASNQTPPNNDSLLATPKLQDCKIGSVNSAILVPAAVTATTPEHFVDKIESLHADTVNGNDLAVFLATPSFASWLLDDSVFLAKALAKLYKNIAGAASLQAVCAVVDRLPQARLARGQDDGNPIDAARVERATHPPVNETGVEGIAYVILPQHAARSAQPTVSGEQGSIDFLVHTKTIEAGSYHDRVRVPLANTVFQTGMPSTLITSSWSLSSGGKLDLQLREQLQTMSIDLSAQRLESASQTGSPRHHDVPALSIPLVPLTFPRKVNGHMGNIIRGLEDANGNAMTASTELELVVPRYFKERGETPQATSAWAVVSNKHASRSLVNEDETKLLDASDTNTGRQLGPQHLWTADPPHWDQWIQNSFARGARLHKVLSGGGGWGKKAGLLSLDPMPIGAPQSERVVEMDGDYETVDEFSTALKPVVKDGDYIQFYISPAVAQDQGADVHGFLSEETPSNTSPTQPWSWEFGVIPSTIDSIPGDSPQKSSQAHGEIAVHKGVFGALTEGGLTLMRGRGMDEKTGIARKDFNATTIDVPFARWSAMRVIPKEGVKLQSLGELRALNSKLPKKPRMAEVKSNVSVRDFSTSTFATPGRPTAAPLVSTIQTTQWPRTFSGTSTSHARRAWLPYKQHAKRKRNSGTPPTEQSDPVRSDSQYPPEAVKAILGNLKIPVWKRATITKVRHHFDDVQWAGQKDRNLLIRKTKTEKKTGAPGSGSSESSSKQGLAKKTVLYRPSGIETTSETDFDEPKLSTLQEPSSFRASDISSKPNMNDHSTRRGSERSKHDRRTISMAPKRPDTVVNEWDLDASTWGQSSRSFSTTNMLAKHKVYPSHTRRKKKRQLKRAEQGLPPVLRPIAAPPRPLIRKIDFSENEPEPAIAQEERTIRVRKLFDAQAPLTPPKKHTPRNRKPTGANNSKLASQGTTKADKFGLPRLLRQIRGEVPLRNANERANGEAEQDFAKLERFLWREHYRIVSSVRKISKEVSIKKAKPARRKEKANQDGAVRKIAIETPPDKLAQQCFADMQATGRHIAMLTRQLESITGLSGRELPTWIGSTQRKNTARNRHLIRTIRLTSASTHPPKSRPRIPIPRRKNPPHRNPPGPESTMHSFALAPRPSKSPITHLLATATRTLKHSLLLSAQTRALLPTAPPPISTHPTRIAPRSRSSRMPTRRTPAQKVRARRVLLGGWKHMYKYFSRRRGVRGRKNVTGGVVRRTETRRKGLVGDVEAWLTGEGR